MSRGPNWSDAEISRALSLRDRGLTHRQIASVTGRPFQGVRDKLKSLHQPRLDDCDIRVRTERFVADGLRIFGGAA